MIGRLLYKLKFGSREESEMADFSYFHSSFSLIYGPCGDSNTAGPISQPYVGALNKTIDGRQRNKIRSEPNLIFPNC